MKTLLRLVTLLLAFSVVATAADNAKVIAAVRAADDERVAATKSGDRARLEAVYSSDLHYAHSNGKIDNQKSYVDALVKRSSVYQKYDYQKREFRELAPGIVEMTGRVLIEAGAPGKTQPSDINFLGIWRNENGKWRFVSWQSCKNLPPESGAKK
jgi:hypothetical protein